MPFAARITAVALAVVGLAASTTASLARPAERSAPAPIQARTATTSPALTPPAPARGMSTLLDAHRVMTAAEVAGTAPAPPLIARVKARRGIVVRRRPSARSHARRVSRTTEWGSRRALAVHAVRGNWLGVASSARTDGRLGWVHRRARGLVLRRAKVQLEIDLSARGVRLRKGDRVVRTVRAAVGAPGTPTPAGRFSVTDKLRGGRFGPYYGCCILALSGTQPRLPPGWGGGNRLAIHGTDARGLIGTATSAGCLRAADRPLRVLMRRVPLGTPVRIHK